MTAEASMFANAGMMQYDKKIGRYGIISARVMQQMINRTFSYRVRSQTMGRAFEAISIIVKARR